MRRHLPLHAFLLLLGVGGCGPQVDAPPLTVRPVEAQAVPLPAETSEPATAADPALAAALAGRTAAADAGHRRFAELARDAGRAAETGGRAPPGSEAWTGAQQALTALVAARGPVRDAASAVEALRQEPANAGTGARAAVEQAARHIQAMDEAEAATIAALSARLG